MLLFIFLPASVRVYHSLRLQFICSRSQSFAIPIIPQLAHFSSKDLTRSMPINENLLSSLFTKSVNTFIYYAIQFIMNYIWKKLNQPVFIYSIYVWEWATQVPLIKISRLESRTVVLECQFPQIKTVGKIVRIRIPLYRIFRGMLPPCFDTVRFMILEEYNG